MKNLDKYVSIEERADGFREFCIKRGGCLRCPWINTHSHVTCVLDWLNQECEFVQPAEMPTNSRNTQPPEQGNLEVK